MSTSYNQQESIVIASFIHKWNNVLNKQLQQAKKTLKSVSFAETYSLKRGLAKFGEKGHEAALGEMKQLHQRDCFYPIHPDKLSPSERKKVLESLIFLVEKRDGRIKARTCANGSVQRVYMDKEDAASPTVSTEAIVLTAVIDAMEGRDVATVDLPNAFIQTKVGKDKNGDKIVMKVRGPLVDMLVSLDPLQYQDKVVIEGGQKVLYLVVTRAIYGMLQSALLFYKKFRKDIEAVGFKINPYDPCTANKIIQGKQMTIVWHVDDLKISHKDPEVITKMVDWLQQKYGDPKINKVKATRGNKHDYLAMILDYSVKGKVKIDMTKYVQQMLEEFPLEIKKESKTPATEKLFTVH